MATKDTGQPANGISRRAFVTSAAVAATAAGCGFEVAFDAAKALAYESSTDYKVTNTTCPYCSASCGQRVVTALTGANAGKVVDIYGDFESPMNSGGLCAKGAGSLQLVNNPYRIGAWETTHPVNSVFAAKPAATTFGASPTGWTGPAYTGSGYTYGGGVAYWRLGDEPWNPVPLDVAMADIAGKLKTAREYDTARWDEANGKTFNSKSVAFFGSSHMNNEMNYVYRKIIANFGTSNVEHQARI